MTAAVWIWRQFPRQIAADLRRYYPGTHIKQWHRATRDVNGDLLLSSYELLELIEHLPDGSAFKSAAERGGQWPRWQQMLAEIANESYRFRSAYHTVNGGEDAGFDTEPLEFVDPVLADARAKWRAAEAERIARAQAEFEAAMGFS